MYLPLGSNLGQPGPNPGNQMGNNMVGPINQMQMNMQGGQMNAMNNMNMPMNMNASIPPNQMNAANLNQQMNAGQHINPNQMSQMLNRMGSVPNIVQQNAPNVGNQMNQAQMVKQLSFLISRKFLIIFFLWFLDTN